jgi:hypothetical protein
MRLSLQRAQANLIENDSIPSASGQVTQQLGSWVVQSSCKTCGVKYSPKNDVQHSQVVPTNLQNYLMIISEKAKFIFVHVHKTAGISIEETLLKNFPDARVWQRNRPRQME